MATQYVKCITGYPAAGLIEGDVYRVAATIEVGLDYKGQDVTDQYILAPRNFGPTIWPYCWDKARFVPATEEEYTTEQNRKLECR